MTKRVSADDLALAAEWLDAYDDGAEDAPKIFLVAEWLRTEAVRRQREVEVRKAAKRNNVSTITVRRALARLNA